MYLENGDEVIELDNGKFILANSGSYCDEYGNLIGGNVDMENNTQSFYVTKSGKVYHSTPQCRTLRGADTKIINDTSGYKPCKVCCKN